jgi:glycine cleavage system H lipoate-binding protein
MWAVVEDPDRVRVGLDDFSQKLLGRAQEVRLPEIGKVYYQNHLCLSLFRQGNKASFEAPLDGAVEAINPRVQQNPHLVHDDPYGEGWLFTVRPVNLRRNLENLVTGEDAVLWINQESERLLQLLDTAIGVTLPSGGAIVDDVIGQYPDLGWRRLAKEFFLQNLTKDWKKRS